MEDKTKFFKAWHEKKTRKREMKGRASSSDGPNRNQVCGIDRWFLTIGFELPISGRPSNYTRIS